MTLQSAPLGHWKGEAPGRLDFLGGVADYSGSLVLQTPVRATTRVTITPLDEAQLQLFSTHQSEFSLSLQTARELAKLPASGLPEALDENAVPQWARYSLGCFLLFSQTFRWWPQHGLRFEIESDVATSMGVSSSAALEVATLRALEQLAGLQFSGTKLAKLAQRAENEIVGAPCGLMDQLASVHGVRGALLPILCRPDILGEAVALPDDVLVVGWPSGVKHAVSDSPYATARAAAFMGKKIIERVLNNSLPHLTLLAPSQVRALGEDVLPPAVSGAQFLNEYDGVDDHLSHIEPQRVYPLRAGALFPVEENFRCRLAAQLLREMNSQSESSLQLVGELMFQSHAGYSTIGLGCPETDAMVEAVRQRGAANGFYGARVSGGGSGGTVVVLLHQSAVPALESLAAQFATPPLIF